MAQRTFTVGVPEELLVRVEAAAESRGLTRNGFVRKTLEAALNDGAVPDGVRSVVRPVVESAASPRASVPKPPSPPPASTAYEKVPRRPRVLESSLVRRGSEVPRPVRVKPPARPKGKG